MSSPWWARRDQLDPTQVALIETLPLNERHLILGPPGSGKTNVLVRRAQFVRSQGIPNVLVLTFTRALTEFVKTGCLDANGREIFPRGCVTTLEAWTRQLYAAHMSPLPPSEPSLEEWKKALAIGALSFSAQKRLPILDAIFVDEAQDLLPEEVALISEWGNALFFVGDDRQTIHGSTEGFKDVQKLVGLANTRTLPFHYRLAPELCRMADRIFQPTGGGTLESSSHYDGPKPGAIQVVGPLSEDEQLLRCSKRLKEQLRVYVDLIQQGDRLGVVVARQSHRDRVWEFLEADPDLAGKSKVIRARSGDVNDFGYDPAFEVDVPINIVSVKGCKGLEFRALHWLFAEELSKYHANEHYYTVVTRAKTSLDITFSTKLPQTLARAHAPVSESIWTTQ